MNEGLKWEDIHWYKTEQASFVPETTEHVK